MGVLDDFQLKQVISSVFTVLLTVGVPVDSLSPKCTMHCLFSITYIYTSFLKNNLPVYSCIHSHYEYTCSGGV